MSAGEFGSERWIVRKTGHYARPNRSEPRLQSNADTWVTGVRLKSKYQDSFVLRGRPPDAPCSPCAACLHSLASRRLNSSSRDPIFSLIGWSNISQHCKRVRFPRSHSQARRALVSDCWRSSLVMVVSGALPPGESPCGIKGFLVWMLRLNWVNFFRRCDQIPEVV